MESVIVARRMTRSRRQSERGFVSAACTARHHQMLTSQAKGSRAEGMGRGYGALGKSNREDVLSRCQDENQPGAGEICGTQRDVACPGMAV